MDDVDRIQEAYSETKCTRCCVLCCGSEKRIKNLKSKYIFKRWPTLEDAPLPTDIVWQNFGFGKPELFIRRGFTLLVAVGILTIATFILS